MVSLRGPYDSFSADRAAPISTGHRAASVRREREREREGGRERERERETDRQTDRQAGRDRKL